MLATTLSYRQIDRLGFSVQAACRRWRPSRCFGVYSGPSPTRRPPAPLRMASTSSRPWPAPRCGVRQTFAFQVRAEFVEEFSLSPWPARRCGVRRGSSGYRVTRVYVWWTSWLRSSDACSSCSLTCSCLCTRSLVRKPLWVLFQLHKQPFGLWRCRRGHHVAVPLSEWGAADRLGRGLQVPCVYFPALVKGYHVAANADAFAVAAAF